MLTKRFITANELLLDSFKLAEKIYASGFKPHFIIGVWRGGSPVGIAVQEFLDYMGINTDHIAIRTSSYCGINKQKSKVRVHGLDYVIKQVETDQELLIVDDVFDSGRSINTLIEAIRCRARKNTPRTIKVACPWYKPSRNVTNMQPDYYLHTTNEWLVFPHELQGLSLDEIRRGKGDAIASHIENATKNLGE